MKILKLPFKIMYIFGLWIPIDVAPKLKMNLHKFHSFLYLILVLIMTTFEIIQIIIIVKSFGLKFEKINEIIYMTVSGHMICIKLIALAFCREELTNLQEKYLFVHHKNKGGVDLEAEWEKIIR